MSAPRRINERALEVVRDRTTARLQEEISGDMTTRSFATECLDLAAMSDRELLARKSEFLNEMKHLARRLANIGITL